VTTRWFAAFFAVRYVVVQSLQGAAELFLIVRIMRPLLTEPLTIEELER
jgi:hypothetical protein